MLRHVVSFHDLMCPPFDSLCDEGKQNTFEEHSTKLRIKLCTYVQQVPDHTRQTQEKNQSCSPTRKKRYTLDNCP